MGAAAAAILLRREREIVAAFRDHRATAPDSAKSLDDVNVHDGLALSRLRDHAAIRDIGSGRYYLDEPSWAAVGRMRRRMAVVMLFVAIAMLTLGFVRFR